jgi:hypothetical protein
MAGAAANPAAVSAVAYARRRPRLLARGQRPRADLFCPVCSGKRNRSDSRRHSPICGCRGAALFTATAALHQESRRPRRSYALGIICSDREQIHRDLLTEVTRVLPRHRNSGYFVIKLSLWIMAAIILAQAFLDIARPVRQDNA